MDELATLVEDWCKENDFPYMRRSDPWEPTTLTIQQKNGLLITIQECIVAINDHTGFACRKDFKRNEEMHKIEYLDFHDPEFFNKLTDLIVGKEI
jgi:hypothetical protein